MSLFKVGEIVATPGAIQHCEKHGISPLSLIAKHAYGVWGDLSKEDIQSNVDAVAYGDRILSSYPVGSGRVWVITEASREYTTVLLPSEY